MTFPRVSTSKLLALLVGAGLLLRLAIFWAAEHDLEVSEAIVGLMALDILAGKALPFFFYGTSYNGGGALEAYLAAASFALLGPGAAALKLWILALWLAAAALLADLCRRTLPRGAALLAVGFFGLGTPFFLEWSLKARGGFIETVLGGVVLLWLAAPPAWLRQRVGLQCAGFGLSVGAGLWASEMLLAMVPCAGAWLLLRLPASERPRALGVLGASAAIGLLPLLVHNWLYEWQHLRSSVLYRVLQPGAGGGETLSLDQLELSLAFVLGPAWPLLALLFAIGAARLLRQRSAWQLGHVALVHLLLYAFAYALAGERYLAAPPSRVLFSLYPSLAILFGYALAPPARAGVATRGLIGLAVAAWVVAVSAAVVPWIHSGLPRESGSWRGTWALTDGNGLLRELVALDVTQVYASRWTVPPLVFAQRRARASDPGAPQLGITAMVPPAAPPDRARAAIVTLRGGALAALLAPLLEHHDIPYRRAQWQQFTIYHGIPTARIHQGIGLPAVLASEDWPPQPDPPDGFN